MLQILHQHYFGVGCANMLECEEKAENPNVYLLKPFHDWDLKNLIETIQHAAKAGGEHKMLECVTGSEENLRLIAESSSYKY